MDYTTFVELVNRYGADKVLVIYFDNDRVEYFKNDDDFKMEEVEDVDGKAIYMAKRTILSAQDNKTGKGGKLDIPVIVASAEVQGVIFLENTEDRKRVNWANLINL